MHLDQQYLMLPVDRFRQIVGLLDIGKERRADAFWLRFAAHLVALRRESPEELADSIMTIAGGLRAHSPWYGTLASPVRFAVAAMLAQSGETALEFIAKRARIIDLLAQVGLRPHGIYCAMTALILHLTAKQESVSYLDVARLKAIYDGMKHNHWWLTGTADLPASAALAHCSGTAAEVVQRTEDIYQRLHREGLHAGRRLQNAASLLPLVDASANHAVRRYLALRRVLEDHDSALYRDHYSAVSVLSLLFQDPRLVIDRVKAVRKEIDLATPTLIGDSSFALAADLTTLDLLRFDHDQQLIADVTGLREVQQAIATFQVMMAVILCQTEVEPDIFSASYDITWI